MSTKKKTALGACDDINYGHGTIGDAEERMGGKAFFVVETETGKLPKKAIEAIRRQPYVNHVFKTRKDAVEFIKHKKTKLSLGTKSRYDIMTGDELRYLAKYGKYGINYAIE